MKLFTNLTIAKKLIFVFVVLSLIWCMLCGISFKFMLDLKASYSQLLDQQATTWIKTKEIQVQVANQNYALLAYMVATGSGALGDQKSSQLLKASNEKVNALISEMKLSLNQSPDQKTLAQMESSNKLFKQKSDEVIKALENNRVKAEVIMQNEVSNLSAFIISNANEIANNQQKSLVEKEAENTKKVHNIIWTILYISLATLLTTVAVSYLFARKMSKPLVQMVYQTEQIALGNLQTLNWNTSSGDEIGKLATNFRQMTGNLRELIERIASSSNEIGSNIDHWQRSAEDTALASRHIANIMQNVQFAVSEQMESVSLTNHSALVMSQGILQITDNVNQSAQKTNEVLALSLKGTNEMNVTAQQMHAIRASVGQLQTTIQELNSKIEHIGGLIGLISNIAKQTNVLALNASIEASRAGTQGRGFAVIANEVRNLAVQTALSALEITKSIEEIRVDSQMTSSSVQASIEEVEQGISAVGRVEQTFAIIQQAIGHFSESIQEVATAAHEIKSQTNQVVIEIDHIDKMSQSTSSKTQEASAATEEQLASMEEIMHSVKALADLSDGLQAATRNFKW